MRSVGLTWAWFPLSQMVLDLITVKNYKAKPVYPITARVNGASRGNQVSGTVCDKDSTKGSNGVENLKWIRLITALEEVATSFFESPAGDGRRTRLDLNKRITKIGSQLACTCAKSRRNKKRRKKVNFSLFVQCSDSMLLFMYLA